MGRYCPMLKGQANYLMCQECDERRCEEMKRDKEREERRREKYWDFGKEREKKRNRR